MQRYFVQKENINKNTIIINGKDSHHIKVVMRMKPNDRIIVCDNEENDYLCKIESIDEAVHLVIEEKKKNTNELNAFVTIAQGLVRKEKSEEVLRKIVEIGAKGYLNVNMERCNIKLKSPNDFKIKRLNEIVKECSEQSERGKLLEVFGLVSFKEFLNISNGYDLKLVAYEECGRTYNQTSIFSHCKQMKDKKVLVLIGPEGGISKNEIDALKENGFIPISLGKRILRTETAPLYIMSIISSYLENGENDEN